MTNTALLRRHAATLILVRDAAQGIEVLLMQRRLDAAVGGGAYVFPGGGVESTDEDEYLANRCVGLSDAAASRLCKLERDGLSTGSRRFANALVCRR